MSTSCTFCACGPTTSDFGDVVRVCGMRRCGARASPEQVVVRQAFTSSTP